MWSLLALLLLPGCSTPTPPTPEAPTARAPGKAKTPGKARKSKAKAPAAPLGVAGPVTGELTLVVTDAAPPPAPPAEGAPPPAPVPAAKTTEAGLLLTFSDAQTAPVSLGKVPGTCTDAAVAPIGPAGQQQTPLWAVHCENGTITSDLAILQAADQITVMKATPGPDGAPVWKPVKRVRLATGATLTRKSG